jgi:multidrug efflux pump subunit AcrA (membrane-fusion protein)
VTLCFVACEFSQSLTPVSKGDQLYYIDDSGQQAQSTSTQKTKTKQESKLNTKGRKRAAMAHIN